MEYKNKPGKWVNSGGTRAKPHKITTGVGDVELPAELVREASLFLYEGDKERFKRALATIAELFPEGNKINSRLTFIGSSIQGLHVVDSGRGGVTRAIPMEALARAIQKGNTEDIRTVIYRVRGPH